MALIRSESERMPASIEIRVQVPSKLHETIECAAAVLGMSVNEFIVRAIGREAQQVLIDSQITRLTNRDRDIFLEMLDDVDRKPNAALVAATNRYKSLRH